MTPGRAIRRSLLMSIKAKRGAVTMLGFKNGVLGVRVPKLPTGANDSRRVAVRTE